MASSIPIEYETFSNRSILHIDWTLIGITTPGQSRAWSNGKYMFSLANRVHC